MLFVDSRHVERSWPTPVGRKVEGEDLRRAWGIDSKVARGVAAQGADFEDYARLQDLGKKAEVNKVRCVLRSTSEPRVVGV